ncbi:hypothetical protein [Moraxella porci]|uniref:hypothetical protein n=1 Tax=Moraxella porci TaxID=1288392 RepID=UPI00244C6829|nr:hypothetical protein [Moraxella porci]MDH2274339.1 hypothetical protein [Moraxella porci]
MYEWMWLIGLCLLLLVLFLLALLKPRLHKSSEKPSKKLIMQTANTDSQQLKTQLAAHLSDYTIEAKSNRLLISQDGSQIAIITLDDHAVMRERLLDGVLILSVPTRFGSSQLTQISDQVRQHAAKQGLYD